MGEYSDISKEISVLENKIREYERCINSLCDLKHKVDNMLREVEVNVYYRIQKYDLTGGGLWQGNSLEEAKILKEEASRNISKMIDDCNDMISDINRAIYIYEDSISNCRNSIKNLEFGMKSLVEI